MDSLESSLQCRMHCTNTSGLCEEPVLFAETIHNPYDMRSLAPDCIGNLQVGQLLLEPNKLASQLDLLEEAPIDEAIKNIKFSPQCFFLHILKLPHLGLCPRHHASTLITPQMVTKRQRTQARGELLDLY